MHTFIVRVWDEGSSEATPQLRGVLEHVPSRTEHTFHSTEQLVDLLSRPRPDTVTPTDEAEGEPSAAE